MVMKTIITTLLLLMTLSIQADLKDWERKDKILWYSYLTLNVIDTGQTFDLIDKQREIVKPTIEGLKKDNIVKNFIPNFISYFLSCRARSRPYQIFLKISLDFLYCYRRLHTFYKSYQSLPLYYRMKKIF